MSDTIGCRYLPVTITFKRPEWRSAMHWYKSNPYYFYPYIFASPFVTGMNKSRDADFPEAEWITADSGGFQISKLGKKVSCLDVLEWQVTKIKADVAFTVDVPAYAYRSEVDNMKYYPQEDFKKYMEASNQNAWTAASKLEEYKNEGYKTKIWAVIQGGNYTDMQQWYKHLTTTYGEFPGYTFPMWSSFNPAPQQDWLSQLKFAKEIGTDFHFLGKCEPLLVTVFAKLAQKTKRFYSYDTSSAAMGLMMGKYHEPYFMSSLSYTKKNVIDQVKFDMDGHPPCDCPVCVKHTNYEMINNYYPLLLHNVYVRKRWNDYVNVMVQDDNIFDDLINKLLRAQPVYQKNKEQYKEGINNLIYDEAKKSGGIDAFF